MIKKKNTKPVRAKVETKNCYTFQKKMLYFSNKKLYFSKNYCTFQKTYFYKIFILKHIKKNKLVQDKVEIKSENTFQKKC